MYLYYYFYSQIIIAKIVIQGVQLVGRCKDLICEQEKREEV